MHPTQFGGLAGRNPTAPLLHIMLMLERAQYMHDHGVAVLSLDARKCFDKLSFPEILRCAHAVHVPMYIMRALTGFWCDSVRHVSAHASIDLVGFRCFNGIPQGCALSVLMCIVMVQQWTAASLSVGNVWAMSYVDDRYLYSREEGSLLEAWDRSQDWERGAKWELNVSKSSVVTAGDINGHFAHQGERLAHKHTLRALGTEMPAHCNVSVELIKTRFASAVEMAGRIALLQLPLPLVQQLIQTIVIPRSVYQLVPCLPRVDLLKQLTSQIKGALQMKHRRISWHVVCACVWKGQHVDPLYAQLYTHVKNVCHARRQHPETAELWPQVSILPMSKPTRGPCGVWAEALRKLHVQETLDGHLVHPRVPKVHLYDSTWDKVKQFWSGCVQDALLLDASERRPHLRGILDQTEINLTLRVLRNLRHPFRSELINITCDGIWCGKILAKMAGPREGQATCEFCDSGAIEDPEHLLLDCPRWREMRKWDSALTGFLREGPAATRHCLHAPLHLPQELRARWHIVQEAGARILHARNNQKVGEHEAVQAKDSLKRIGPEPLAPLKPAEGTWVPFRFTLTFSLRRPECRWTYPRTEWHRVTRFIGTLGIWEAPPPQYRWPSICDLFLSFVLLNGGECFQDGMPEDWRGGWLGTQLESFTYAIRTFQELVGCPKLVPLPNTKTEHCSIVVGLPAEECPTLSYCPIHQLRHIFAPR